MLNKLQLLLNLCKKYYWVAWVGGLLFVWFVLVAVNFVIPKALEPQNKRSDIPKGLKEKTETLSRYIKKDGKYRKTLVVKEICKYNKKGEEIEYLRSYINGAYFHTVRKYDSHGRDYKHINYEPDGSVKSVWKFKYDNYGNCTEQIKMNLDGTVNKRIIDIYKYDKKGNVIETIDPDGGKFVFKYDNNGNRIEWYVYNSDGSLNTKHLYKYDNRGNEIYEAIYGKTLQVISNYKYDKNNNKIEVSYEFGEHYYKTVYKYDKNNNPITNLSYDLDGKLFNRKVFEYDKDNNLIKEIEYRLSTESDESKEVIFHETTYEYEYWD